MENFKISQDIYDESLKTNTYRISDEVYSDTESVTKKSLLQELSVSYKFSGRYWIWKIGNAVYSEKWKRMLHDNEMQMTAQGFKYLLSYPDLASLQHEFFMRNVGEDIKSTIPAAYFAFSRYLRRGDVIMVVGRNQTIVAWGIVEGSYMYRPTRRYGHHYRKVAWNKVSFLCQFADKDEVLFQVPNEKDHFKDFLIDNLVLDKKQLPFGFVKKEEEMSLLFEDDLSESCQERRKLDYEKRQLLESVIGSLVKVAK